MTAHIRRPVAEVPWLHDYNRNIEREIDRAKAEAIAEAGGGATTGEATLDFGASPADTASVTVTADVTAASYVNAWFQASDSTVDNDATAHAEAAAGVPLSVSAGSGSFTITAHPLWGFGTGTFKVRYSYQ